MVLEQPSVAYRPEDRGKPAFPQEVGTDTPGSRWWAGTVGAVMGKNGRGTVRA